jgi:hypothetical protein
MNKVKRPLNAGKPVLLTRVKLSFVSERHNVWLRFGYPNHYTDIDRFRRRALFTPGSIFCRVHWESNPYGMTRWQLMVLQAGAPGEAMQKIVGIHPAIHMLLKANGERQVKLVLDQLTAIEALGIKLVAVSPAYWRTVHNRLAARLPLPVYTAKRHTIHLAAAALR